MEIDPITLPQLPQIDDMDDDSNDDDEPIRIRKDAETDDDEDEQPIKIKVEKSSEAAPSGRPSGLQDLQQQRQSSDDKKIKVEEGIHDDHHVTQIK